jgi:uncharacterized OB-fold protein
MTERTEFVPEITDATEPYWEAANDDRLVLQHCGDCSSWIFYPRELCPHCFSEDMSWEEVSGRGTVYGFSVLQESPIPAYQDEVPYVIAVIELEEGPRMFTNIVNCAPEDVSVDCPVEVTFERRDGQQVPQFELTAE